MWKEYRGNQTHRFGAAAPAAAHYATRDEGRGNDECPVHQDPMNDTLGKEKTAGEEPQSLARSKGDGSAAVADPGVETDDVTETGKGRDLATNPGAGEECAAEVEANRRRQRKDHQEGEQHRKEATPGADTKDHREKQPGCDTPACGGSEDQPERLGNKSDGSGGKETTKTQEALTQQKPLSEGLPAIGTSGADRRSEETQEFETSIQWPQTKRGGKKRSSEAIEGSASSSGEEEEEDNIQNSGGEEEEGEEMAGSRGEEVEVEGHGLGSEEDPLQVQEREEGAGMTPGGQTRAHHGEAAVGTTVARRGGSGPTAIRDPRRRGGSPARRKEGVVGPGKLNVRKGMGKNQKRRRGRVKVNAPLRNEGTPA